jgi:hypothetical protein
MQLEGGRFGPLNTIETKSSKHQWINRWLDCHQNHNNCGIVWKDDTQTPNDKIVFIQSHCAVESVYAMFICRDQM